MTTTFDFQDGNGPVPDVPKFAPSKIYALLSVHYYALHGIFATQLGAEQARGKLDFPTIILEWEVGP